MQLFMSTSAWRVPKKETYHVGVRRPDGQAGRHHWPGLRDSVRATATWEGLHAQEPVLWALLLPQHCGVGPTTIATYPCMGVRNVTMARRALRGNESKHVIA